MSLPVAMPVIVVGERVPPRSMRASADKGAERRVVGAPTRLGSAALRCGRYLPPRSEERLHVGLDR